VAAAKRQRASSSPQPAVPARIAEAKIEQGGQNLKSQNLKREPTGSSTAPTDPWCSRPHMPGKGRPALPGGLANCPRQTRLQGDQADLERGSVRVT